MRLLVTGGCGFIGSALVRRLVALGHEVVNVDALTYASTPQAVEAVSGSDAYHLEVQDICDHPAINAIFQRYQPAAVMHLAAESHVDRSISAPAAFIQTNVIGTYCLLEATRDYLATLPSARRDAFRFLHISTDEVYGDLTPEATPFSETDPYRPNSPYSASKAASDHLVRAWHVTYGVPTVTTNASNNYGPWQAPEKLIPVVITSLVDGRPVPVYGDGLNVRDWIHVDDHVEALIAVLHEAEPGMHFNIGGNSEVANIDLVRTICGIMDEVRPGAVPHYTHIQFVVDRPGHDRRYAIDNSRIKSALGWEPRQDLQHGLRETVLWYLQNEDWWREALQRVA